MKIKRFLCKLKPPCPKCPYKLGLVKTLRCPCPGCKLSGYRMFERFSKMSKNVAGERKRNMVDTITMPDGAQVKTLEELREHFDLISVLEYYTSGMLLEWLKSLHYEKEADAVAAMNPFMPEFEKTLCSLFQVSFSLEEMMAAYEKAARENCAEAQFRLGCCYLFGYGVVINRGTKGITKR